MAKSLNTQMTLLLSIQITVFSIYKINRHIMDHSSIQLEITILDEYMLKSVQFMISDKVMKT